LVALLKEKQAECVLDLKSITHTTMTYGDLRPPLFYASPFFSIGFRELISRGAVALPSLGADRRRASGSPSEIIPVIYVPKPPFDPDAS